MQDKNCIVVEDVTYTHFRKKSPALTNFSLSIPRGALTIIVGPSGSGKTTLCQLFNGVIPHLAGGKFVGRVLVDGLDTRQSAVKDLAHKVGVVFQDPEVMFATLQVEDEIAFGPENLRTAPPVIRQEVEKLLDFVGLNGQRRHLVWELSGGQVQKLGLACVLAMHPEVIVLDEPTANLDPVASQAVHNLILSLRDEGKTVILVTKELDEFMALADNIVILDHGRVIDCGHPREVLGRQGAFLLEKLGIYLPETTEIGLALKKGGIENSDAIPITVPETLAILERCTWQTTRQSDNEPESSLPYGEVLIDARDISFSYPGKNAALHNVSLQVRQGEFLAIVGRNGAGKSTLAKLLVGLIKPDGGELMLFGKSAKSWKPQMLSNHIALVFQNPEHQFLTDTVYEEVSYSLLAQGIADPAEVDRRVNETLRLLDLEDVIKDHPFSLSAGKKRRLGVATMLVGKPRILLVDEPTYGQDREMTRTLMALMADLRRQGITLMMITHDMRLVQEYAERAFVMSDGEALFDGPPEDLFGREELLEKASLRPTALHRLVAGLRRQDRPLPAHIRTIDDLLGAISGGQA
jgi:energy-coupling factor transport system ATP-binding protein